MISQYERLGGQDVVRRLVDTFYDYMDSLPEAEHIRAMHADDLTGARDKLFKFLSGWLGGPALYVEEYGHPMLRARHLPFKIGSAERDAWMLCMTRACHDIEMDSLMREHLLQSFFKLADHMRNQHPV